MAQATDRHGMIRIFTPSFADEHDTNAQNLTVKEIVARLNPDQFHVRMFHDAMPDPRICARPNTHLLRWQARGNTIRTLGTCLLDVPDVYFYPREGPLDAAFLKMRRRLRWRTRVVAHVVSGGLDENAPRPTLERNIREADAVFGNCTYISELVRERTGVQAQTIHNGIDARFFFPREMDKRTTAPEGLRVLYAGSFRPYKRVDLVVRHAARWPTVQFRIAGRGEEEERCRLLASELGCQNIAFLGHLRPAALGEEMRGADVFFFPSALEGHPQVLGQAAACGLPVVARNRYRPDYVVHQRTGLLAGSDDELGCFLDHCLQQPEIRKRMSAAAIAHARQFSWEAASAHWEQAFYSVMALENK